jgi:hypothetical protein
MNTNLNALPPQRPDCFESAMEFLDEPEAPVLLAYVEALEARVALAQPEPQGPTRDELRAMAAEFAVRTPEEFALAVLARWGRPAITPTPVSERPWEREGWCDAQGRCWRAGPCENGWWSYGYPLDLMRSPSPWTHMLPHWALPVPTTKETP